jgi:formylmethanofuran dehydrogenase subunit E
MAKRKLGLVTFVGYVTKVSEDGRATILLSRKYSRALKSIRTFSHLVVLYWIHNRDNRKHRSVVQVVPKRHPGAPLVGVFASRSPSRPNPIGLCVVKLISVRGGKLVVDGLDALAGSPIVDIKPYVPRADSVPRARTPKWAKHGPAT